MNFWKVIAASLAIATALSFSQIAPEESSEVIINFIKVCKTGDRTQISKMVSYPFNRPYPIPSIKNADEFVKRFEEVFNDSILQMIIHSKPEKDWSRMGWRGIMYGNGQIWLNDDGLLIGVNEETVLTVSILKQLAKNDKMSLPLELQQYNSNKLKMKTKSYHFRIDELDNGFFRLVLWANAGAASPKVFSKGKIDYDGSGGNHHYEFAEKDKTYTISIEIIGDGSRDGALLIEENGKIIFEEDAFHQP